ncbi:MAG: peptidase domain-containing ABC transporter [Planctomyces sp.]
MSTNSGRETATANDLISASWIFEQIAIRDGLHADRSRIRRAVDEAAETYFGIQDGGWWRWIIESGNSLGQHCRVIEGDLAELIQLASDGVVVILRSRDGDNWCAVTVGKRRRLCLWSPVGGVPFQYGSPARIAKMLRQRGFDSVVLSVVVESSLTSSDAVLAGIVDKKPLDRLFALMRAESSDVWVVVIFALVSGLLSMTTPLAVEALVNTVAFGRFLQPIVVLSLMLLAFLIFQAAMKALQTFVVEIIQRRMFARVAADLSFRLPRTQMESLDEHYAPELVNRFFDVITIQKISSQLLLDGLSVVLSAAVGMVVLAFYHPLLLAFDVVLILMLLFTMVVLGRGAVKTSIKESKTKYAMVAWLEDLARCTTTFRYDGAESFALEKSDQLIFDYLTARKKHFRVLMRQLLFLLFVQAVASTALLAIGGWLVISGQLSLGQLVAAELIVAVVVGSFAKLGKHMESFYDLMASVDKIGTLLDLPIERTDGLLTAPVTGEIGLKNVFWQNASGTSVINDLSLDIRSGEKIALSGSSGSGKSIVLDLLFGLREAVSGTVMVSGINPRDLRPDVLRRQVALVRDVEVFQGTIAENIHLERPDISLADVREMLGVVGLLNIVQQLPDGIDTALLSTGAPLSMTQRRRLMIARALCGRPKVVLIDQILDCIPDEEAEEILRGILNASESWSVVLVTSRECLSRIMDRTIHLPGNSEKSST